MSQAQKDKKHQALQELRNDLEFLSPYITAKTPIKVKFKNNSQCQHEWDTTPSNLLKGQRCSYCRGKKPQTQFIPAQFDITNYLNEARLGIALEQVFKKQFINNKIVPNSNLKTRPDFRNDELMLIVEFDGYKHYTEPSVIYRDRIKDETYSAMGYKIVRIPYFIQLETRTIKTLFGIDYKMAQEFPHGFIVDDGLVCPAGYCKAGYEKYKQDKTKFKDVWCEVEYSLKVKMEKYPKETIINDW